MARYNIFILLITTLKFCESKHGTKNYTPAQVDNLNYQHQTEPTQIFTRTIVRPVAYSFISASISPHNLRLMKQTQDDNIQTQEESSVRYKAAERNSEHKTQAAAFPQKAVLAGNLLDLGSGNYQDLVPAVNSYSAISSSDDDDGVVLTHSSLTTPSRNTNEVKTSSHTLVSNQRQPTNEKPLRQFTETTLGIEGDNVNEFQRHQAANIHYPHRQETRTQVDTEYNLGGKDEEEEAEDSSIENEYSGFGAEEEKQEEKEDNDEDEDEENEDNGHLQSNILSEETQQTEIQSPNQLHHRYNHPPVNTHYNLPQHPIHPQYNSLANALPVNTQTYVEAPSQLYHPIYPTQSDNHHHILNGQPVHVHQPLQVSSANFNAPSSGHYTSVVGHVPVGTGAHHTYIPKQLHGGNYVQAGGQVNINGGNEAVKKHGKGGGGHHESGQGSTFHKGHSSKKGSKGDKGYKKQSEHEKKENGHKDSEGHKGEYGEEKGHKDKNYDEGGYYGDNKKEEEGGKDSKFGEGGSHKKGHSTHGEHNIVKKDEYIKKTKFYDEDHDGGKHEKHGQFSGKHATKKGGHKKGGHKKSGFEESHLGKKGHHEKGHHDEAHKGYDKKGGHESHYELENEFGGKKGSEDGKKWGYSKGSKH